MKIKTEKREKAAKNYNSRLRREGKIPACLYAHGHSENQNISMELADFEQILRKVAKGELSTMQFALDIEGKSCNTLIKDIQYDPITYRPLHIDFIAIEETRKVKVNVPLRFKGAIDCVGVKLGGVLRQVLRYVKVQCVPSKIPTFCEINVAELGVKQSKKIKDISLPEGVRLISSQEEVTVTVAKR